MNFKEEVEGEENQNDGESYTKPSHGSSQPNAPAIYYQDSNPTPKPKTNLSPEPKPNQSYYDETSSHQSKISFV